MDRLIDASGFDGTRVVATVGIDPIPFADDDHDDHDDEHGEHGHDEHGHDEHGHDEHGDKKHADDDHDHEHGDKEHADDDHDHEHGDKEHADDDHDHEHGDKEHAHDEHDHDKEHAEGDDHDHDHDSHAEAGHDDHGDHKEHAEGGHHGHDHGAFDPHAWQSLSLAMSYVDNITAGLAKADPDNASAFYENRAAYVAEIEALEAEIRAMFEALPEDRRTVVTSHDAFGYFGASYGLTFLAPQGLSTASEPSAADLAAMISQIRDENISAVFIESTTDNRLLEQISNETGVTIGGTLYSGALSGPDGPASTYLDMMRHNATTLAEALGS